VMGAQVAVYLVHSMLPSARLTQGSFHDIDLLLADNFARACKKSGVQDIIYLSGLIPDQDELSLHLASRAEVEGVLEQFGTRVTSLRAGMIVGAGGSSFRILTRLVKRLPWMICPSWTQRRMQPIDVDDVAEIIKHCIESQALRGGPHDIGGPDVFTYEDLIRKMAEVLGRTVKIIRVPWVAPWLSVLWLCLITRTPRSLVGPLVGSLCHDMVATRTSLQRRLNVEVKSFICSAKAALAAPSFESSLKNRWRRPQVKSVRSVQRFAVPTGRDADWLAQEYLSWLGKISWPLFDVERNSVYSCEFRLRGTKFCLLRLHADPNIVEEAQRTFRITGGLLVDTSSESQGRFEFRTILSGQIGISAIHDFKPRLPWFIYNSTQAIAHSLVMWRFRQYLSRKHC